MDVALPGHARLRLANVGFDGNFNPVIEIAPGYQKRGIGIRVIASLLEEADSLRVPVWVSV